MRLNRVGNGFDAERARKASIRPMELALMHGSVQRTINRLLSNRRIDAHTRHRRAGANRPSDVTIANAIVAIIKRASKTRVIKLESRMCGECEKQTVLLSGIETQTADNKMKSLPRTEVRIDYRQLFMHECNRGAFFPVRVSFISSST